MTMPPESVAENASAEAKRPRPEFPNYHPPHGLAMAHPRQSAPLYKVLKLAMRPRVKGKFSTAKSRKHKKRLA